MIPELRKAITDEIVAAFGFSKSGWARSLLSPLFWLPAHRFARLSAQIDEMVEKGGLPYAAEQLLPRFVDGVQVEGRENIPHQGALLIASNHPGAYDILAILANQPRRDIKVVVSDVLLLQSLPAVNRQMIYTPAGQGARASAVREIIRYLQTGGSVLIFPTGKVDPDPRVSPNAEQSLQNWSPSLDLILRKVPETRLLVTIVSGVLVPSFHKNPLTRLIEEPWRKQKLAEFLQVMQQMLFKTKFGLKTRITFGEPLSGAELLVQTSTRELHPAILQTARQVFLQNMRLESV